MKKIIISIITILLLAGALPAQEFKFLGEYPTDNATSDLKMLNSNRYVWIGAEWMKARWGSIPESVNYKVFDIAEKKVIDVNVPVREFYTINAKYFVGWLGPDVVYHNGEITALIYKSFKDKKYTEYFCYFDHKTKKFSKLTMLLTRIGSAYLQVIGFSPDEKHLYYMYNFGSLAKIYRMNIREQKVDWDIDVPLPKRTKTLHLNKYRISFDGKKIALVEHNEKIFGPVSPEQQAYVVDIVKKQVKTYPAPLSSYGISFSRDSRYLALGSCETGGITKIDTEKGTVEKTEGIKNVHIFIPSPSGKTFFVFAETWRAEIKGQRLIEVRNWANLKLALTIPVASLFPGIPGVHPSGIISTLDGKYLVTPVYEKTGFPGQNKGIWLYEITE